MGAAKAASAARRRIFFIGLGSFESTTKVGSSPRKTMVALENLRDHS